MNAKTLVHFILFILLATGLSACAPKKSEDCGFVQNAYGQRISWKASSLITLHIDSSVPVELRAAVHRAAASWEQSLGRKVFEVIEDTSPASLPGRDKKNGIYFLSQWESDRKSEQGRTSVYWAGDEIQEADIRINSADFVFYDQNPKQLVRTTTSGQASAGYNFEALILHELGHFLGLKHSESGGTVMARELGAYTDRVSLAAVDVNAVQCEYR